MAIRQAMIHKVANFYDWLQMLGIATLDLQMLSLVPCHWSKWISEGDTETVLFPPLTPTQEPKGTVLPAEAPDVRCYGEAERVGRGAFVRHQISPGSQSRAG